MRRGWGSRSRQAAGTRRLAYLSIMPGSLLLPNMSPLRLMTRHLPGLMGTVEPTEAVQGWYASAA